MFGLWLTRIAIWIAVAAWLIRVVVEVSGRTVESRSGLIRWTWLIGAVACAVHVAFAMWFAHCGSLATAMRHTADVTRRVIGIELPESVFANFAFMALWLIDAIREFQLPHPRTLGIARHVVWGTMMINGTVIFGPKYWWWIAVGAGIALIVACRFRRLPQISG